MTDKRPVYLNLLKIRLPVTGMVSFAHRVSGVLLFLFIPYAVYLFDLSLGRCCTIFLPASAFFLSTPKSVLKNTPPVAAPGWSGWPKGWLCWRLSGCCYCECVCTRRAASLGNPARQRGLYCAVHSVLPVQPAYRRQP